MASACRPNTSIRGVIASAARLSPNRMARCSSTAVSLGSAPALAERAASSPSSSGDLALASSSCGSMPIRRTSQFAEPLRARIRGEHAEEKAVSGPAVARATGSGRASAAFFGTSSPNSMDSRVARASASTWAMPSVAWPVSGRSGAVNSLARAGSAR